MVAVTVENKVLDILNWYIQDNVFDELEYLNIFTEQELTFSVKFHKYKSCLNAPAAKVIIDFQNAIYRIAALHLHGKSDIRLLSQNERERLEIPFRISESSTLEEATKLLSKIKELLNMIPKNQRATALVAVMLIIFGYFSWNKYWDYQEKELEHQEKISSNHVIEQAIEKMHEQNSALTGIIVSHEKNLLKELSDIDEEIEFQGQNYTKENLETIRSSKYKSSPKEKVEVSTLKGEFTINHINIKEHYLIVEATTSSDPIKIYYSADDLIGQIQNIKAKLKVAIDDENKRFYIEASIIKKNKKTDVITLSKIEEGNFHEVTVVPRE